MQAEKAAQEQIDVEGNTIVSKGIIELEVPSKKQRIVITVTKKQYLDSEKKKMITDQVIHRARYSLANAERTGRKS
jgi:hypothetical protein